MTKINYYGTLSKIYLFNLIMPEVKIMLGYRKAWEYKNACNDLTLEQIITKIKDELGIILVNKLDDYKQELYKQIDNLATKMDEKYTSTGGQMAAIYQGKIKQCEKWRSNGEPNDVSTGPEG